MRLGDPDIARLTRYETRATDRIGKTLVKFFKRGTPDKEAAQEPAKPSFAEIKPDPDAIGIAASVPFVHLPKPAKIFAERAQRLRALAPGHALEAYLLFIAGLVTAQAECVGDLGEPMPLPADTAMRIENGMPPLSRALLADDPVFLELLDRLLARVDLTDAPAAAQAACRSLREADAAEKLDLAVQVFGGALPMERMAECLFVAAALQLYLAAQAARLDAKVLKPVADGVCPCCGAAPVASLIVGFTPADKARYLACGLCGTYWNHVRIRCTACGSGEDISYYGVDEVSKDVQVETCKSCNAYLKHLHQHRDPRIDPVADDIASYGLDLKIAEEGFRKAGLNLLFVS